MKIKECKREPFRMVDTYLEDDRSVTVHVKPGVGLDIDNESLSILHRNSIIGKQDVRNRQLASEEDAKDHYVSN